MYRIKLLYGLQFNHNFIIYQKIYSKIFTYLLAFVKYLYRIFGYYNMASLFQL